MRMAIKGAKGAMMIILRVRRDNFWASYEP